MRGKWRIEVPEAPKVAAELTNETSGLSVTVSSRGRFHAFDLARELHLRGVLRRLITTYPKFKIREWDIPNRKSSAFVGIEILNRAFSRGPCSPSRRRELQVLLSAFYDRIAARRIPEDTSLFVGWSGGARRSLRRAKALGARTICERGSCHIRFQDNILAEEHDRLGVRWERIHPESIAEEEHEYMEADFVSVPSNFVRQTFVRCGIPERKILVTPYGCDLSVFRPEPKLDTKFRLIHCGQIAIHKGVHILIQAFSELRLPDSELWLIGSLTPEIAKILARYPESNISVKGPFPQKSLPAYYSQGSVFCMASLQEGLALVIPQAMSCGLPVIATENSGAAEIVDNGVNGFIIPACDVDALKEKILMLYIHPQQRDAMAARSLAARADRLSWSRYGDKIVELYEKALGGR